MECDGDAFHTTPEQLREDLEREIELRRCGWTFWRVRESEFYADRVQAMSTLWTELDSLGIKPGGSHGTENSTVSTVVRGDERRPDDHTDVPPTIVPIEDCEDESDNQDIPKSAPVTTAEKEKTSSAVQNSVPLIIERKPQSAVDDGQKDGGYTPGLNARDDLFRRSAAESDSSNAGSSTANVTLQKVLVAAAWSSVPLTIDRACHIARLDESETR